VGSGVGVVYPTYRLEPRFEWFADSLVANIGDADIEVIVVDGVHSPDRTARINTAVRGRFPVRHVPAKPTPYNGRHRLTRRDYFAAASARNTGVVYASRPYIVFVDDAAVLMPGWWDAVREAARDEYVIAGAYQKRWEMVVEYGVLESSRPDPSGMDVRWPQGSDTRPVPVHGSQLYGCSFGIPRGVLLTVNGLDEMCDLMGGEDSHLGTRLEYLGVPVRYSRRMLTFESQEIHWQPGGLPRLDKVTDRESYMLRLRRFGLSRRSVEGRCDSSHMIVDILHGTRQIQSLGNYYHLRILSERNIDQTVRHFPRTHWFDGQPLDQM
jgi:Glycosyl transferase family 2